MFVAFIVLKLCPRVNFFSFFFSQLASPYKVNISSLLNGGNKLSCNPAFRGNLNGDMVDAFVALVGSPRRTIKVKCV